MNFTSKLHSIIFIPVTLVVDIVDISVVGTVGDGVGAVDALEPISLGFSNIEKKQKYFSGHYIYQTLKNIYNPISNVSSCYTSEENSNTIRQYTCYTCLIDLLPVVVPTVEVVVEPSS